MESDLNIKIMTEDQFSEFVRTSTEDYARTSPFYQGMPAQEALEQVRKDFSTRTAPQGLQAHGQYFLAIMKGADQIGYFHFGVYPKESKSIFAWNFFIHKNRRGRGYGRISMQLAEEFLRAEGFKKVSFNVFADNDIAIKLYESFGFETTQVTMARDL